MYVEIKEKKKSNYQGNIKDILSPHYVQTVKKKYKSSNFTAGDVLRLFFQVVDKISGVMGDC